MAEAVCFAQGNNKQLESALTPFFDEYTLSCSARGERIRVEKAVVLDADKELRIFTNETLGVQPFTQDRVTALYDSVRHALPATYHKYALKIYTKGILVDDLVAGGCKDGTAAIRTWKNSYSGPAWVTPLERPYSTNHGLQGRHLSLWASHGIFYSLRENTWHWQRPRLYSTREDLLSQTFVVPFLIPMLENAGAVVFTPRERDWQKHEAVVDNDTPQQQGIYTETNGTHEWATAGQGFAHLKSTYVNGENPFTDGTARQVTTQQRATGLSTAEWTPTIPVDGSYAVYVSYTTLPTSVPDAVYTVRHKGQSTRFLVNQQMGGGTWVYLGTFDFAAGNNLDNCVLLSNQSAHQGVVTADAVRFGGGMGNIARGAAGNERVSGMPRFLEGARYAAQWAGMEPEVYANKDFKNDYAEDINARSLMTNYLAGGSLYLPGDTGLHVPIEMSIALHTDAGISPEDDYIGTLGIYTTDFTDGLLPAGLARLTSRDLCDQVVTQVEHDLSTIYGHWTRRQIWDRNYSETREPGLPSMILEMLSHQNFSDMLLAHDPHFKFTVARAAYKGILRAIHRFHGSKNPVVQPLPVTAPAAYVVPNTREIHLSWLAVEDPLEPTAMPNAFVVYHAENNGDWDNGTLVTEANYVFADATPDVLHRFRITACNAGGQSMPSTEVCAYTPLRGSRHVMLIDAFDRLAAPICISNDSLQGFDLYTDPGVPMAKMPGFCGQQQCFERSKSGGEGPGALGHSTTELEGMIIAGNTLDWSTRHARDILAATNGQVTISSCTQQAVGRAYFDAREIDLFDIIFGLDKTDTYSTRQSKVFTPALTQVVAEFVRGGGNLLVSGAFVGSDMTSDSDRLFTRSVLKYEYASALSAQDITSITGLGTACDIYRQLNEQSYCVPAVDCLAPVDEGFCTMVYSPSGESAAVAYQGSDYHSFVMGFPLESIKDTYLRVSILSAILRFLIP